MAGLGHMGSLVTMSLEWREWREVGGGSNEALEEFSPEVDK